MVPSISYGLSSASAVLQCLIKDTLKDMLVRFVTAYIDVILILSTVFSKLYYPCLTCKECCPDLAVIDGGISEKLANPLHKKGTARLLGFANFYRHFIRKSSIYHSLHSETFNPAQAFIIEIDGSNNGVGARPSQHVGRNPNFTQ